MPKKNTPHFLMMITLILITNYLTLGMNISTSSSMIEEERPRRLKNKIKKDINRYMGISERLKLRSKTRKLIDDEEEEIPIEERQEAMKSIIDGAVKLPMYAAAEYEMGEYVVDIEVGNPPTKLHLVVDTASDLTWVKCKTHNFGILDEKNVLDLDNSLTYQPISCHHSLCKEDFAPLSALEDCPTSNSPCMYNYSYGDAGLSTYGMFGKEMITLPTTTGKPVVLENLLVGCSESYTDKDRMKKADGVLGLGINPYSFSVHAVTLLGGCFSYCLVDHLSPLNITNYLIFGNYREKSPTQDYMRFTTLQVSESAPYFWVNVKGISIDDKMLDIEPMVWDSNTEGGTILDSGTAATYWATPAYRAIMDVLIPVLKKDYPKLPEGLGDGKLDFEYCFNSTKTPFKPKKVPRLGIHFRDGARFTPLVKSYIVDDGPGVNCIGFLEAPAGLNIIGNIMQQNYLWEFDLQQNTVGFAASVCK